MFIHILNVALNDSNIWIIAIYIHRTQIFMLDNICIICGFVMFGFCLVFQVFYVESGKPFQ